MTRIFISIDLPVELQLKIREIQHKLPKFNGKLIPPENLHLTLKFLGDMSDKEIDKVKKQLSKIRFSKFVAKIDKLGVFSENYIRIIWLHLSNCDSLQKIIDAKLRELGYRKETLFMSHLTIARVKSIENKNKFMQGLKKISFNIIEFEINNFRLKKSVLTDKGAIYSDVEIYKLY